MFGIVVFILSAAALFTIAGLSLFAFLRPGFEFWPPPNADGWQHGTFRMLFRVFFVGLLILSFVDFGGDRSIRWPYLIGIPLLLVGFGLALYWTNFLGWRNAFGEADGLKTEGVYQWSRNPVYVVSIVGMIGWGLIVQSWWVNSLLATWALLYVVAPFLEEPWLKKQYGQDFEHYKVDVPRFVRFRMTNTRRDASIR